MLDPLWLRLAIAATRLAALGTLLGVISLVPVHPLILLEHFRLQLLLGSGVIAIAAAVLRQAGWVDLAALGALLNLVLVTPGLSGTPRRGPREGVPVRLLLANGLTSNTNHAALRRLIAELRPDLIALVEVNQRWMDQLQPALQDYSGRLEIDDRGNFGVALYARGSLRGSIEHLGSRVPTIVATIELAAPSEPGVKDDVSRPSSGEALRTGALAPSRAATLTVVVTHPIPPMTEETAAMQRSQLAAVARRVAEISGPIIVAGDLNATPWSRPFATFLRASGLHDSREGFGVQPSFPAASALLRIPIDHILLSHELGVRDRWIGADIGSDHLPVVLDLVVPPR